MNNWTEEELNLLMTDLELAIKTLKRSKRACYQKKKEIEKKKESYNKDHVAEKYFINELFLNFLQATTVIDAYAGSKSYWKKFSEVRVITNDVNTEFDTDFHMPAKQFIKLLRDFNVKADIVDLDAFGSPWEEFEDSVQIAEKGLIMTFGDKIYSNYNNDSNFSRKRYGINEYDIYNIIGKFKERALKNGIILEVYSMNVWKKTWRVWFIVKKG